MQVDFMDIFRKIASCGNVNMTVVKQGEDEIPDFDLGIRKALLRPGEKEHFIKLAYEFGEEGTIYYIKDYFDVEYCLVRIPEKEKEYGDFIILGPYRDTSLNEIRLAEMIEGGAVPRVYTHELKEYYNAIPTITDLGQWRALCIAMIKTLYGDRAEVCTEYVSQPNLESEFLVEESKDDLSFKILEERYAVEGEMLKAVANGNTEEALKALNAMGRFKMSNRYKDPIRELRNVLITANTLFRKSAEMGGVHPAHIDALSTQYAKKVETVNTQREAMSLITEMLRKYCMLVRNYSLRGCSPVVQKVVNHINLNLTDDLSLKRLSGEYSVNASYLSALFKKEMGVTLSDYVSQQRIRKAIKLLNSTNMQIQDVASESGIYDVNYFRKLFKKMTGQTPTEYVRQIKSQATVS